MPDTDRILEAEQTIQNIASELKRMRDAANLLETSQTQLDAVLASAQKVVQTTEKFSSECGVIVTRLAARDLNQRLDGLQTLHSELATAASSLKKIMQTTVSELQGRIQAATGSLSAEVKAADEHSHSDFEQVANLVEEGTKRTNAAFSNLESQLRNLENQLQSAAKGSKGRQITTFVFVILTLVVVLVILAKALAPSLGGWME